MKDADLGLFYGPTPFADDELLDIHGVGVRERMHPGIVDRPQGTDDILMMVFHQPVAIGVEGTDVECPADTLLIWQPLAPHRYGRADRAWMHSWLHLAGRTVLGHVSALGLPLDTPITGVDPALVEACAWAVHREVAGGHVPDAVIVENALSTLLRQVARVVRSRDAAVATPELAAVRAHLERNFHKPVDLAGLARRCGWSASHFCTRFTAAYGVPPIAFVVRLRLGRARALLRDPRTTVAQAAAAVGYDDPRTFARLARRHLGRGPKALRK